MSGSLSLAQARRIALAAQLSPGAGRPANPGLAAILKVVDRLNLLQIDSVNVLTRSHYLPLFSRLGPYDRSMLDQLTYGTTKRRFFEYWAHEASFLPMRFFPLLRWRMDDARSGNGLYGSLHQLARDEPAFVASVLNQVRSAGPLGVRDLKDPGKRLPGWWGWSPGKIALEYLFWTGDLSAATRRNFERIYDLTERVIPEQAFGAKAAPRADAVRELMRLSMRALGVAAFSDLRDYFRLPLSDAKKALAELLESRTVEKVEVENWPNPGFILSGTSVPRRTPACSSLISPFDPLVWERERTERLFGFSYRIEIYTPAAKRRHGYYVLPFLMGDRFAARVCLKANRAESLLVVNTAHKENSASEQETADALSSDLAALAGFLGLAGIAVKCKGNLAPRLKKALGC